MKKALIILGSILLVINFTACQDQNDEDITKKEINVENNLNGIEADRNKEDMGSKIEEEPYLFSVENLDELRLFAVDIFDYYTTSIGDSSNFYEIDSEGVLWGYGSNQYGQLGQGYSDNKIYDKRVKIAENVIHVDYSQSGFVIFLTEDNELYGVGNDGTGALLQQKKFSNETYINGENYAINLPIMLMKDVKYAKCGRNDVIALKKDDSVWSWGLVWYENENYYFQQIPLKVLENVKLITGGAFNHAALKKDGTLWTWGYNYTGNCGVKNSLTVSEPQQVEEKVKMVWTGKLYYNVEKKENLQEIDPGRELENTIIQKEDGTFWACGINIGNQSKKISPYYEIWEFETICTSDFLPCKIVEKK